ncbi:MAG: hypothetical protein ACD_33C00045G0033 [uncultured bacterium]|nr:MAG: hypothetical protein ACD_33C00045G0033 [uncultured bacterium]
MVASTTFRKEIMERKKIPFSKNFYINTNGDVFDEKGNKRKTYINGDGYITVTIKTIDNVFITYGVHRLVALAHIPNKIYERNQVNHRISDLTNNNVSNLEWVTPSENNIHSEIMRSNNFYNTLYSTRNNIPLKFYINAHLAADDNNCTILDVWDSVKDGIEINGIKFHYQKHSGKLPLLLKHDRRKNFRLYLKQGPKVIKMLDIDTGDIITFKSIGKAAKHFNVTPSHIYTSISKNSYPKVFNKKYQITYIDQDFPIMNKEDFIRAKEHGRKKVIAYNIINKTYIIFESAIEFINYSKVSKKAVTVSLKKNQIRQIGNWISLYLNSDNIKLLKSNIDGPADILDPVNN